MDKEKRGRAGLIQVGYNKIIIRARVSYNLKKANTMNGWSDCGNECPRGHVMGDSFYDSVLR